MSGREELLALAERVEAASGPDRELDAEIAVMAFGMGSDGSMFFAKDDTYILERDYYSLEGGPRELPAYTASLDAGMAMVPELLAWHVSSACPRDACATIESGDDRVQDFVGRAATPALALTAAALKALAHV